MNKSSIPSLDALIGTQGIVTKTITTYPPQKGLVKLDGELWPASSLDGGSIAMGVRVTVDAICGVRLIVSPK